MESQSEIFSMLYLPRISWIVSVMSKEKLLISLNEVFDKAEYRNRFELIGANGKIIQTIPLLKWKKKQTSAGNIKISNDTNWQHVHWQSIQSSYGKCSYFLFYSDDFKKLYNQKFEFLIDWNTILLQTIFKQIRSKTEILLVNQLPEKVKICQFHFPEYYQPFSHKFGFSADQNILDLIFNLGPDANKYLQNLSLLAKS